MALNAGAEAEINEFGRLVFIKYDVFEFDISVGYLPMVEIAEGGSQLLYDLPALPLAESLGRLLFE